MTDPFLPEALPSSSEPHHLSYGQFDIANRLFFRLYQCTNLMHKVGARFIGEFNSTTQQWAILGALARPPSRQRGMTVKELIAFLLVSRQNLTPVLERLEAREWVKKVRDPEDARNRRIVLTATGIKTWNEMQLVISSFYGEALNELSVDEQVVLYRLLDRLTTRLSKL